MASVSIRTMTRRRKAPVFAFGAAADAVLPAWDISLAFVGETRARTLNQTLRGKDYVPNVLSYESGTKSGEIVICLGVAKKQAPKYAMTYDEFVGYLFIHGLLHLKGYPHGHTMDRYERALLRRLVPMNPNETKNRNGHRHRHLPGEGGRR